MSLQKFLPKNITIYFNYLQSHTTSSIPFSPPFFLSFSCGTKLVLLPIGFEAMNEQKKGFLSKFNDLFEVSFSKGIKKDGSLFLSFAELNQSMYVTHKGNL